MTTLALWPHLGGSRVHHGRREDGHDGGVWIQHALAHHRLVLLDAHRQGNVVVLRPAA